MINYLVIIVGSIRNIYKLHSVQYLLATLITIGLILFNSKKLGSIEADNIVGIMLIVASLLFDGMVATQTDIDHKKSGRDYAYSLMFSTNVVHLLANLSFFGFSLLAYQDDTLQRIFSSPKLLY